MIRTPDPFLLDALTEFLRHVRVAFNLLGWAAATVVLQVVSSALDAADVGPFLFNESTTFLCAALGFLLVLASVFKIGLAARRLRKQLNRSAQS